MRSVRISHVSCVCCFILLFSFAKAQTSKHLRPSIPWQEDPVFGLRFDPETAKYDGVAAKLKSQCKFFQGKESRTWIFAHAKSRDSDYYVVKGWSPCKEGCGDNFGSALWVHGAQCQWDESNWTLSGVPSKDAYQDSSAAEGLPGMNVKAPDVCNSQSNSSRCHYTLRSAHEEAILRELVRDAIQRGIRAFGGERYFRMQVCTPQEQPDNSGYPIMQEELRTFCAKPNP
jgi:hypothetical protein